MAKSLFWWIQAQAIPLEKMASQAGKTPCFGVQLVKMLPSFDNQLLADSSLRLFASRPEQMFLTESRCLLQAGQVSRMWINDGEDKMADRPTIALLGPGAIGTTLAAVLHEAGRTPVLCGRTAHPTLTLRDDEKETVVPGPVLTKTSSVSQPFDLVFVAVKTTQVADCADWLSTLCDKNTVVCALQNGVEQKIQLEPYVNGASVVPSVVWFPAQREPDFSVWLRAKPRLTLPDEPQAKRVADVLSPTRCAVELSTDFTSIAWRKLLQNAVAGLMVLANRRAGMFSRRDVTDLALAYLHECLTVARAEGAILDDSVPQEILDVFHRAPADLGTSILADRQADRPLEWEIRNGVIARYGRAHDIATPISEVLVPLLAAGSEGPG